VKIGFAASEKQAIDAALESLSATDDRFWGRADRYWNARGGSHTDGGAFVFTTHPEGSKKDGTPFCADKFGRAIETNAQKRPPSKELERKDFDAESLVHTKGPEDLYDLVRRRLNTGWDYPDLAAFLSALAGGSKTDEERDRAISALTLLIDRRYPSGDLKRSGVLSLLDDGLAEILGSLRQAPSSRYLWVGPDHMPLRAPDDDTVVAIDATGFEIEGEGAVSRAIVDLFRAGWSRFLVFNARGHRFIGCGLGVDTRKVRIDVYGSPGDYLGSGLDGVEIAVHGSAQDQLAQIMKSGKLVVHGDVGQTFGYGAKGGHMYVLGNAAGRPLINAVGAPRVVINGTALDYLAESFMAGDPLAGGGWVVINGVAYNEDGELADLVEPYPGGNLFSLASGGALYVRDPKKTLTDDQLNAGEFAMLGPRDWDAIKPHLMENERLFGITLERLLTVEGERQEPFEVYRKIQPTKHGAFTPEEAWFEGED